MNTTITTQQTTDYSTHLLEQALAVVEGSFYQLRDEELNAEALFQIRVRLLDTVDTIGQACRYIEALQRQLEKVNAVANELADLERAE
jgi:hypothetical protein